MRPLALKWRVSLLVGATILVGMGFTALAAYVEIGESLTADTDRTLEAMSNSVMALLATPGAAAISEADVQAIVGAAGGRQKPVWRIWFDGARGRGLSSAEHSDLIGVAALAHTRPPTEGGCVFFDVGGWEDAHRAVWARSALEEGRANVAIALSRHPGNEVLEEFRNTFLYAGGGIVLLTIAVTTLLVSVGLRPIGRTARAIGSVTGKNVGDARIEVGRTPPELEPFVRAVTEMLARLADALQEQKRLVSDASHELRTPLSVARSTIEAARVRDRTPADYRNALDDVRGDLERMGGMIEDLLVMARLDEGTRVGAAEVFDLAEVMEDLAGAYEAEAARREGAVALDLQPARVRGDRAQMRRLLSNLLDNAFRHGPANGTVSVTVAVTEQGVAEVRVHDDGGRIPQEALPHLFDRFYRADGSRARATGGVGLGLSIAREIALRHGGDITVTSAPEGGTCFTVRLPAV